MGENPTRIHLLHIILEYILVHSKTGATPELTNQMMQIISNHDVSLNELILFIEQMQPDYKGEHVFKFGRR